MIPESNGTKIVNNVSNFEVEPLIKPVRGLIHSAYQSLKLHSAKDCPIEAVGIICDGGFIHHLINQARSPHRYEVSKQLVVEAFETVTSRGLIPLGFYHSHPESTTEPSSRDVLHMSENPNTLFLIVGQKSIAAWIAHEPIHELTSEPIPEHSASGSSGSDYSAIKHITEVTDVEHSKHRGT